MKVTIDTKEDTHEDIRKVLNILTNILEKKNSSDYTAKEEATDTTSMMSMFDSPQQKEAPQAEIKDTAPDFSSFLNLQNSTNKEEKDEPKIEFF